MSSLIANAKRVGPVSAGLIVGAIVSLISLPVYSRFYSVSDFGVYGLAMAFVSIGSTVATLRLDQAILIAPVEQRRPLAYFSILSAGIISALTFLVFFVVKDASFASAVALGIFSNSMLQLAYNLHFSNKNFNICGLMNAGRTLTFALPQILVPLWISNWTMVRGIYFQSIILIIWSFQILVGYSTGNKVEWNTWKNYRDFIRHNTPHALLNSFSHNSVYYFSGLFLSPAHVGFYTMVDRILKAPIFLFSQVIRQSLIVQFASQPYESARVQAVKISLLMTALSVPFFIVIVFFSEIVLVWALGDSWTGIGKYFAILAFGYLMIFSNPPTSAFLVARRQSNVLLNLQLIELVCKVCSALLLYLLFGNELILASITIALVVYNGLAFYLIACNKLRPVSAVQI